MSLSKKECNFHLNSFFFQYSGRRPVCVRSRTTALYRFPRSTKWINRRAKPQSYSINRIRRLSVCLSDCLFVCPQTPPREIHICRHIVYGSNPNLSGKVVIYIQRPSDRPSGRYCPETGHLQRKIVKNRHFFDVFDKIKGLIGPISTLCVKRR